MEFMEMERQLQDNVTKRLQAILEPEDLLFDEPMRTTRLFELEDRQNGWQLRRMSSSFA